MSSPNYYFKKKVQMQNKLSFPFDLHLYCNLKKNIYIFTFNPKENQ